MRRTPCTPGEYRTLMRMIMRDYPRDRARADALPLKTVRRNARTQLQTMLPHASRTHGHYFDTLREGARTVGYLWYAKQGKRSLFLCQIYILAPFRGRGLGTQAMRLFERRAQALGCREVRLHVFGHNAAARALYEKLGYTTADLVLAKPLARKRK